MNATKTRRIPAVPTMRTRPRGEMACGWCKGFVHEEWVGGMQRYVHDETPLTVHEVLPFRVRWSTAS